MEELYTEAGYSQEFAEQLATLIGEKKADYLLRSNEPATIFNLSENDLLAMGLSKRQAKTLRAAVQIKRPPTLKHSIECPKDIANLLMHEMGILEQEEMRVILLTARNNVKAVKTISAGLVNRANVYIGELFRDAIRLAACSIVLVHNHPSGDPTPSPEDIAVTRSAVQAGKLLDIDVLDHIVLGNDKWISLKERGLGFS
jgi:DNA repair protein RadC